MAPAFPSALQSCRAACDGKKSGHTLASWLQTRPKMEALVVRWNTELTISFLGKGTPKYDVCPQI